jgi:hypothetical protein
MRATLATCCGCHRRCGARGGVPVLIHADRAGGPEQVLVYVFVFNGGDSLYRLVCISQPEGRAKHAHVFGHMAATLKVAPGAP